MFSRAPTRVKTNKSYSDEIVCGRWLEQEKMILGTNVHLPLQTINSIKGKRNDVLGGI